MFDATDFWDLDDEFYDDDDYLDETGVGIFGEEIDEDD